MPIEQAAQWKCDACLKTESVSKQGKNPYPVGWFTVENLMENGSVSMVFCGLGCLRTFAEKLIERLRDKPENKPKNEPIDVIGICPFYAPKRTPMNFQPQQYVDCIKPYGHSGNHVGNSDDNSIELADQSKWYSAATNPK